SYVADRFQYLASISLGTLIVGGIAWILNLSAIYPRGKKLSVYIQAGKAVGIIICVVLGYLTFQRARVFESLKTLSLDTLKKNPNAWSAHVNYGNWLFEQDRLEEALAHFHKALSLKPGVDTIYNCIGAVYAAKNEPDTAIAYFQKAIELNPNFAYALANLGTELLKKNQVREAILYLDKANRLDPLQPVILQNLALALVSLGEYEKAMQYLKQLLSLQPANSVAHKYMAKIYQTLGQEQAAIFHFRTATTLLPQDPEIMNDLGLLLATAADTSLRSPAEAINFEKKACTITEWQNPDYLYTLALSYASAGDYASAVNAAEQALKLYQPDYSIENITRIKKKIEEFKSLEK
ncbi:MAG: tetratricopeptide repeat protein, partial [Candidatus Sumerlaeia bacterium]|nr:tetratricopeptide repeat protein [Candidatus Sumerlaeia bacterium]